MKTDRELLELAALAAGIQTQWESASNTRGVLPGLYRMAGDVRLAPWNPLHDDGDALRLAVVLGLNVYHLNGYAFAESLDGVEVVQQHGSDANDATRRAIVRAAAEIGEAME